jgi:hypothetical protein
MALSHLSVNHGTDMLLTMKDKEAAMQEIPFLPVFLASPSFVISKDRYPSAP